ncbi:MAG: hypothetical protein R6V61_00040, partial [Wenzhouxiangellaceae bacterium]
MIRLVSPIILASALIAGEAQADQQLSGLDDDKRFTRLTAPFDHELGGTAVGEIHAERFKVLWSDEDYGNGLEGASDEAVFLRVRAAATAATAAFYKPAGWILERYRTALEEAERRGIATEEHFGDLFDAYLAASLYDQASDLAQSYPDIELPEVPDIVPPGSPPSDDARTLWRVADDPPRLEGFHVELDAPQLLIVSSPGCGFCRLAARALPADEVLGPLMREHAIWLVEKSSNNTYPRMLRFNREYPETPHYFVDDHADWPIRDFSFTPRFHFVGEGKIVETLAGWRGGSEALWAIARGFESIGLLDAEALPEDAFAYADEQLGPERCPTRDEARKMIAERTPIMSRKDLEKHLEQLRAGSDSPLLQLSQEGRTRLIESI